MQDQVAFCASDRLHTIGSFKIPLQLRMPIECSGCYLYFKQNGSQNLGKPRFPTRLLMYYKRMLENKYQQPEEQIPWAKLGERAQNFHFHSMCATFPNPHVLTIMKVLQSLSFWVFMEASLHKYNYITGHFLHTPQKTGAWNWKFQPSNHLAVSLNKQPPILSDFPKLPR